jgi:L-seryl-tRNA(Ser) seleniumtransferase
LYLRGHLEGPFVIENDPVVLDALRTLPSVEQVVQSPSLQDLRSSASRQALVSAVRAALESIRRSLLQGVAGDIGSRPGDRSQWIETVRHEVVRLLAPSLRPAINATGVIIHTNLGRSLLAEEASAAVMEVASRYSNLEFDLDEGRRGSRYVHVEGLLRRLTGAEAAMVVNNNAGAVLISLSSLARGKEVVVSRGELVEIGGAFRMPDVMLQSGALLVEVGTTNKTHLRDYEAAVGPETGLLLKVHTSNYRILGFTQDVSLDALAALGHGRGIPVMNDLGSGCLVDLGQWGLEPEPTVQDALRSGVDVVTFSGDKLLGGPQAGLILGRPDLVDRIRRNPLARALRIDKMTLAALWATLQLYWDPQVAVTRIPTLRMLVAQDRDLRARANLLARRIRKQAPRQVSVHVRRDRSQVGGGSLPLMELPTWVVSLRLEGWSAARIEKALRGETPPVIARISKEEILLDVRTVQEEELQPLSRVVSKVCAWTLETPSARGV